MTPRGQPGLLAAGLLVMAMVLVAAGTGYALHHAFPFVLDGEVYRPGAGEVPNHVRNFFELVNFISSSLVVPTALFALFYASGQVSEARKQTETTLRTARAGVYNDLRTDLMSDKVKDGLMVCRRIEVAYAALSDAQRAAQPLADFSSDSIQALAADPNKYVDYVRISELLALLEYVGLMVRREYVLMDDVYYLMQGQIIDAHRLLIGFIDYLQLSMKSTGVCEHAKWLMLKTLIFQPIEKLLP